jgi:predicted Fe-Mo cluster-binding NifX family protein
MKLFFPVENNAGLDSKLDSRFGRAAYFLIYDTDTQQVTSTIVNEFKNMEHGVGLKIASMAIKEGCTVAIGAQPGPKAVDILEEANLKILAAYDCTVREALHRYSAEIK